MAAAKKTIATRYRRELDGLAASYALALLHDVTGLAKVLERTAQRPMVVVGSGGSFSVATYCAGLHRRATGQLSRAMTPLMVAAQGGNLDAALLCVSASGSNVDIKAAFSAGVAGEMRPAISFALVEGSPLANLAAKFEYPDACSGPAPAVDDGFLAVNSVLVTCLTFARAYREIAGRKEVFAPSFDEFLDHAGARPSASSEAVAGLGGERTLSVMFSPALEAAAVDLESRFVEAALGPLHIADFRNFGHGRHNWFDKRGETTAVLSLAEAEYAGLADRTLKLLPAAIPRISVSLTGTADEVGLAGLVCALYATAGAGEAIGVDPGRPGVPEFGRKLYRLAAPGTRVEEPVILMRKRRAVERRGGSVSAEALEAARARSQSRIAESTIRGVVLDYDGTLVDMRHRYAGLPAASGEALRRLVDGKLSVGIATGRGKSVGEALRAALPKSTWERVWIGYYNGAECVRLSDVAGPRGREPEGLSARIRDLFAEDAARWEVDARQRQVTVTPKRRANACELLAEVQAKVAGLEAPLRIVTSSHSLDILCGDFSKLALVEAITATDGVEADSILRIGDRGAAPGNDYQLLRHPLGLSVDEVSGDLDSCWRWTAGGCLGPRATMTVLGALSIAKGKGRLDLRDMASG